MHAQTTGWETSEFVWNWGIVSEACTVGVPKNPGQWYRDQRFDLQPYQISRGDIVWVKAGNFKYFARNILPYVSVPFVLVVNVGDESFPSNCCKWWEMEEILENEKIIHIFAQNCDYRGSSKKISPIPIGVDYHTIAYFVPGCWGEFGSVYEQEIRLKSILSQLLPTSLRKKRAFVDFHLNNTSKYSRGSEYGGDRLDIFHKLLPTGLIDAARNGMNRSDLWKTKGQYAFSICPYGNGIDTHRVWEDLILGCICIVKSIPPLDPVYEGLPVVLINDWSEITEQNLEKWLIQYQDAFTNPLYREKLTNAYWINKIRRYSSQNNP